MGRTSALNALIRVNRRHEVCGNLWRTIPPQLATGVAASARHKCGLDSLQSIRTLQTARVLSNKGTTMLTKTRRVVTGHDEQRKSVFVSDGIPARCVAFET